MKNIFNKVFSLGLICLYLFTPALTAQAAKTCSCPPPGYNEQARILPNQQCCPVQTCCPQQPCCQEQAPCCPQQPCCEQPCSPCGCDCGCGCESACCCDDNSCAKIEHLCTNKNTPVDLVKICGCRATIEQHAVIETTLGQKVFSKRLCPGDRITFTLPNGLWTREGRKLLPACSQIIARVECIVPPKALNKNAKVSLKFCCVLLPNGQSYPIQARIFNSEGMLKETKLMAAGKVALWTIGLLGVGTGLGAAFGASTRHAGQAALTIGMPVGFGVGLLTGLLSPGLHYRGKCGEKVLIQLTDCLQVNL